jgi:hypothetical protein
MLLIFFVEALMRWMLLLVGLLLSVDIYYVGRIGLFFIISGWSLDVLISFHVLVWLFIFLSWNVIIIFLE